MNGLPYYKAYPRDFIEGTIGMDFETKGAYRLVLDLIYMQGGELPDDARYISGLLGCSIRKWNSLRETLIEADKLQIIDGFISNKRARNELETLRKLQDKNAENRSRPNKNKDLKSRPSNHTEPEPDIEKEVTNVTPKKSDENDLAEAVEFWNTVASHVGLSPVRKLSETRKRKLKARLGDCDGMDGWKAAVNRLAASSFCRGERTDWKADFDFVLQEKSFLKLIEGGYDDNQNKRTFQTADEQPSLAAQIYARSRGMAL